MSPKEQTYSNDKENAKQRSPKSATENLDIVAQQQTHLATIIKRAKLDTRSLTPGDVMQLQRLIGNHAVGRLVAQTVHPQPIRSAKNRSSDVVQRVVYPNMDAMWGDVHPTYALVNIQQDPVLSALYDDAAAQLPNCDFVQVANQAPQISSTPNAAQPYRLEWDAAANIGYNNDYFAGAIVHELAHAASSQQYTRHGVQGELIWANMNLPAAIGVVDPDTGMAPNQSAAYRRQLQTLNDNWEDLDRLAETDRDNGVLPAEEFEHISQRIQYALAQAFVHNDTVLGDMMYYLRARNLQNSKTYRFARRMLKEANDRRRHGFWSRNDGEVRKVDSRAWWFQFWKW